jgi:DNA-binding XRE family transcriptional regulator
MASETALSDPLVVLVEKVRLARLPSPARRREIRERAGVSLRRMAAALGVDPMSAARWERGDVTPRLDHAVAYRRLLGELEAVMGE